MYKIFIISQLYAKVSDYQAVGLSIRTLLRMGLGPFKLGKLPTFQGHWENQNAL